MALQRKPQLRKLFQGEFVRTIQIATAISLAAGLGMKKRMDMRMEEVKKYLWNLDHVALRAELIENGYIMATKNDN